jgi:preprotein translocase subunit SecA
MDYLQEGIGLRAMGQRDPLVEYQREGFDLFNAMMEAIKEESVGFLFNVEVTVEEAPPPPQLDLNALVATGPGEQPGEVVAEPFMPATPLHEAGGVESAFGAVPQAAPPAATVPEESRAVIPEGFGRPDRPAQLQYTAPAVDGEAGVHRSTGPSSATAVGEGPRPGQAAGSDQSRNSLCHCGSGKKFKRCHGDPRNR